MGRFRLESEGSLRRPDLYAAAGAADGDDAPSAAFCIDESPRFLADTFARRLSPPLAEFLKQRRREMDEGFHEDCELAISFAELDGRVGWWEDYLARYSASPLRSDAEYYYRLYLAALLRGLDNSPVFEGVSKEGRTAGTLRGEVRRVYEAHLRRRAQTPSGKLLAAYYEILKKNDWRPSDEAEALLAGQKIEDLRGIEPPAR